MRAPGSGLLFAALENSCRANYLLILWRLSPAMRASLKYEIVFCNIYKTWSEVKCRDFTIILSCRVPFNTLWSNLSHSFLNRWLSDSVNAYFKCWISHAFYLLIDRTSPRHFLLSLRAINDHLFCHFSKPWWLPAKFISLSMGAPESESNDFPRECRWQTIVFTTRVIEMKRDHGEKAWAKRCLTRNIFSLIFWWIIPIIYSNWYHLIRWNLSIFPESKWSIGENKKHTEKWWRIVK